jgi:hypothetical protein
VREQSWEQLIEARLTALERRQIVQDAVLSVLRWVIPIGVGVTASIFTAMVLR